MFGNMGGMNPQKMLQKMQEDTLRLQEQLDAERLETTSGGGMVKVVTTRMGAALEMKIAPKAADPEDVEMLEDLVVTAVRDALKKAQEHHSTKMSGIMGGLKIPGLGF